MVAIFVTTIGYSQRNPNQTYLTSFVYEAKDGMTENLSLQQQKRRKCSIVLKEILFGHTEL